MFVWHLEPLAAKNSAAPRDIARREDVDRQFSRPNARPGWHERCSLYEYTPARSNENAKDRPRRAFRQTDRDGIPQMAQIISQPSITEKLKGRYIDAIEEVLRANPGIELTQLRPMAEQAWVSALDILIQSERMAQRVTQQRQDEKRANRS